MNHKPEIGDFFIPKINGKVHFIVLGFTEDNRTVELQFMPYTYISVEELYQFIPVKHFDKV